jgi:putative hydroxymethylpyrimidine transport system substrate-binding protein
VGEEGRVNGPRLVLALSALAIVALLVGVVVAGTNDDSAGGAEGAQRVDLMLDFFPNADHAGIYAAEAAGAFRDRGLDVAVRAPSDPAAPLKLVAAGKVDFAISYEPEVLRARDKGAQVVAVAALVRVPLTSIISLPKAGIREPSDLAGKTVGTAGIDYQGAYLEAIAPEAKERNIGFDFGPALVSGKVDATLGAFWNYEGVQLRQKGRDPQIIRMEQAGVPTYDELVVAVSEETARERPETVTSFLSALEQGTDDLARDPERGVQALLDANPDLEPKLQRAVVDVTLPYFQPKPGHPYGFMHPGEWERFARFMHRNGLIDSPSPRGALTNELLPPLAGS